MLATNYSNYCVHSNFILQSSFFPFLFRIKDGNGEKLYPRSSFGINCTGKINYILFCNKVGILVYTLKFDL